MIKEDIFVKQVSAIDPASEQGECPDTMTGDIEFTDVVFSYPSRPSLQVEYNAVCCLSNIKMQGVFYRFRFFVGWTSV